MRASWKTGMAVLALVSAALVGRSGADEVKTPNADDVAKALAEAARPGPEHAKLRPLAGSWTYTCKFWMDPGKPPIETKGTIERRWILGGRFLEEKVAGTGLDGKTGFEVLGLIGYDNGRKKYTATWACTMCTGTSHGTGVSQGSGKFTFQSTCFCPILNKTIEGRDEIRIESQDRVVMESYKIHDGKEVKMMEVVSVRKK